jgi:glyoxylate reductase
VPVDLLSKKGRLNAFGVLVPRLILRHDAMTQARLQSSGRAEVPRERLSVVVTRRLPEVVETRLSELFDVRLRDDDTPMTREELVAAVQEADVLVPTVTDTIDGGLLGQVKSCA